MCVSHRNCVDWSCSCPAGLSKHILKRKQVKYHVTASPKQNQRCVVWLHHRVRHLWWRNHGECFHDTVWVLFSHLGNQECSHACTSASTKGMAQLKSLKAITTFGLLANDIKHGVDQLSSLSVVTFSPVVSCSSLAEDKVVWTEQLAKRSGTNTVHSSCSQYVLRDILHRKQLYKVPLQQSPKSSLTEIQGLQFYEKNTSPYLKVGVIVACQSATAAIIQWTNNLINLDQPSTLVFSPINPGSRSIKTARGT